MREPVSVAIPTELWGSTPFKAWLTTRKDDGVKVPELLLNGIVIRSPTKHNDSELQAYCTLCPHEFCHVEYVVDSNLVVMDAGSPPDHPLLFCGCHFSVFNPLAGGKVISGPAERRMFRFEFETRSDMLYITKVDEDVFKLLRGVL